jgi:hypothetical protein
LSLYDVYCSSTPTPADAFDNCTSIDVPDICSRLVAKNATGSSPGDARSATARVRLAAVCSKWIAEERLFNITAEIRVGVARLSAESICGSRASTKNCTVAPDDEDAVAVHLCLPDTAKQVAQLCDRKAAINGSCQFAQIVSHVFLAVFIVVSMVMFVSINTAGLRLEARGDDFLKKHYVMEIRNDRRKWIAIWKKAKGSDGTQEEVIRWAFSKFEDPCVRDEDLPPVPVPKFSARMETVTWWALAIVVLALSFMLALLLFLRFAPSDSLCPVQTPFLSVVALYFLAFLAALVIALGMNRAALCGMTNHVVEERRQLLIGFLCDKTVQDCILADEAYLARAPIALPAGGAPAPAPAPVSGSAVSKKSSRRSKRNASPATLPPRSGANAATVTSAVPPRTFQSPAATNSNVPSVPPRPSNATTAKPTFNNQT